MVSNLAASVWQQKIQHYIVEENYAEAIALCEQAIESEPDERSHYWQLGLAYVLAGQEADAQTTWLLVLSEAPADEADAWTSELLMLLDEEAGRRQTLDDHKTAWVLRQHIRELDPSNVNNLLLLVQVAIAADTFSSQDLVEWGLLDYLSANPLPNVHRAVLVKTIAMLLQHHALAPVVYDFVKTSIPYYKQDVQDFIDPLINECNRIGYSERKPALAAHFLELALELDPNDLETVKQLSIFLQNAHQHDRAIDLAHRAWNLAHTLHDRIAASHTLVRGLMGTGGRWEQVEPAFQRHLAMLAEFVNEHPLDMPRARNNWMFNSAFFLPYLRDDAKINRLLQNQIAAISQENAQRIAAPLVAQFRDDHNQRRRAESNQSRPLRIGYLCSCFKHHSVGWLARWLYAHHDRNQFQIYSYMVNFKQKGDDWLRDWYVNQSDIAHKLDADGPSIAERINDDAIDILIDLDSLTMDTTCEIMALKPAPVQVTWLGWDASGIPAIDYYIVDPYVVPDQADEYYSETLWRLPQTYIAVDGFELGVPTLCRKDLDIPDNAVVFFSGQQGHKRHPHTVQLQMRILKEVPNSYFLIKSLGEQDTLEEFFRTAAEAEGVSGDRLRFLPRAASEAEHRANLAIADVILDTYPYNGATTTLEVLWVGIPIVTRVGTTFSGRNSYTMLTNVGVTEGIAWTDDEYVEWGIRLGRDRALRERIKLKLWHSRRTAPLWNAKQFTQQMEAAYTEMWSSR